MDHDTQHAVGSGRNHPLVLTRQYLSYMMACVGKPLPSPRRVAENIIQTHGRSEFRRLVKMFRDGERGPKIAAVFGVTRQRVHQWKQQLGELQCTYIPHRDVTDLLGEEFAPSTSRTSV